MWMKNKMYMMTKFEDVALVLTVSDIAKILDIGRNTAYDLIRCGKIKSVRVGKQIRIPKQALIDFLQQ